MAYKISFEEKAAEIFAELDKSVQKRIIRFLEKAGILKNPKSSGKPLTGDLKGLWRYRVGDYRIIAEIKDKEFIILVLHIGHRSVVYK
jgi:mRNA interferase RelE/StbE